MLLWIGVLSFIKSLINVAPYADQCLLDFRIILILKVVFASVLKVKGFS